MTAAIQVPMFHLGMPRQLPLNRMYFRFGRRTMMRLTSPLTLLILLPTDGYTGQTWACIDAYGSRQYSPYFSIGSSSSISRRRRWNLVYTVSIQFILLQSYQFSTTELIGTLTVSLLSTNIVAYFVFCCPNLRLKSFAFFSRPFLP